MNTFRYEYMLLSFIQQVLVEVLNMSSGMVERKYEKVTNDYTECSVCRNPLKRVRLENGYISWIENVSLWEDLYECKKGHVFSRQGLIHLEFT